MKKRAKTFLYNTLIEWGWIDKPERKEDLSEQRELQKLVSAFGDYTVLINMTGKKELHVVNKTTFKEIHLIPYTENPYLTALAYFAYFGIREKQGEGMKENKELNEPYIVTESMVKTQMMVDELNKPDDICLETIAIHPIMK